MNIDISQWTAEELEKQWDVIKPLYEELKPASGEAAELNVLLAAMEKQFPIGTIVDINGTGYTGEVVEYNKRLGGFYPGIRYPLHIRIIKKHPACKHNAVGSVFEYQPDQIFRIDMLEKAYEDVLAHIPPDSDDVEYMKCYNYWLK